MKMKNAFMFALMMLLLGLYAAVVALTGERSAAPWLLTAVALLAVVLWRGVRLGQGGFAALTADRDTHQRSGDQVQLGVATNVKIYAGALVAKNASGYATPGAVATTLRFIGRASEFTDNTGGADNAKKITVEKGIFKFVNYASDLVTIADVGADCFIFDDQTVAKTNGTSTRSVAGKVFAVDSDGVWVDMRA